MCFQIHFRPEISHAFTQSVFVWTQQWFVSIVFQEFPTVSEIVLPLTLCYRGAGNQMKHEALLPECSLYRQRMESIQSSLSLSEQPFEDNL